MELIYLWVEEYKNIQDEEFHFSSRFYCHYDRKKNELSIDKTKDDDDHIFPKNINLTVIVGENGSGKSSVLEQLILLFNISSQPGTEKKPKAWALVYDNQRKWIDIKYIGKNSFVENIPFDKINLDNDIIRQNSITFFDKKYYFNNSRHIKSEYYNLFYNPSIELVSSSFLQYIGDNLKNQYGAIYDLDFKPDRINIFAFPSKKNSHIDIKKNENNIILAMYKSIEILKINNIEFKLDELLNNNKLNFTPSKVDFVFNLDDTEYLIKHDNRQIKEILFSQYNDLSLKSLHAYFIASVLSIAGESYDTKEFEDYFFQDGQIKDYLRKNYYEQKEQIPKNDTVSPIYKLTKHLLLNIEEFMMLTSNTELANSLKESSKSLNVDVVEMAKLIDVLNTLDDDNILNRQQHNIETLLKVLPAIPSFIRVNVYDGNNVCFNDFSYGEKNLICLVYSLIYYVHIVNNKNTTINIFLDEIETGLNPKWQKELINILVPFFSNLNIFLNIIINTHSPFILSDVPKENVIFLEKGEKADIQIDTFGANIHTLLSHGFFMKNDGLMGKYAKSRINEVFDNLQNGSKSLSKKQLKSIIDSIGEPFLQTKLKQMYKKEFGIDDEIESLLSQLDKINLRIKQLQKERL